MPARTHTHQIKARQKQPHGDARLQVHSQGQGCGVEMVHRKRNRGRADENVSGIDGKIKKYAGR